MKGTPIQLNEISIRTTPQAGDLGFVIHRHGKMYADEYGYGISFEMYVAMGMYEFYKNYVPNKDRVWICEHDNKIIGFLLLMHRENNTAQLRYFYLEAPYRGIGLGKKMMQQFFDFVKEKNYSGVYLWTTHEQTAAASMYKGYGFKLTEEKDSTAFGKPLKEQKYEWTDKSFAKPC
jgi:GNAT superfamily N-acetyltransferase